MGTKVHEFNMIHLTCLVSECVFSSPVLGGKNMYRYNRYNNISVCLFELVCFLSL